MDKIRDFDKKAETIPETKEVSQVEEVGISGAKIVLETLSDDEKLLDEAFFSMENLNNAANSFLGRKAALKRIGIEKAGKKVYFFFAKDSEALRPIENIELPDVFTDKEKLSIEGFRQTLLKTMIQIGGI
ncbi:MAG: hypothetical protein IJ796_06100 [Lachnospiraceae bacterium]|nr:hypothetical protein [Lachnospiraceae bacterium]